MINKKRLGVLLIIGFEFKSSLSLGLFLLTIIAFVDCIAASTSKLPTAIAMAAGGYSSSSIDLPFVASSINGGKTWEVRPIADIPPLPPSSRPPLLLSSSCTGKGSDAVCLAGGALALEGFKPFALLSHDGAKTWRFVDFSSLVTEESSFINSVSSIGEGRTAVFVVAGREGDDNKKPLLLVSTNGGATWQNKAPRLGIGVGLEGVSCTGEGSTALCIAAGGNGFVISTDGGNTWTVQSSARFSIDGINCVDGTTCVGVGWQGDVPLIKTTSDKGKSWQDRLNPDGYVHDVSCIGHSPAIFCAGAGQAKSGSSFVTISTDGGLTWTSKPIKDDVPYSYLVKVSCAQAEGSSLPVCAAVGTRDSKFPLIVTTIDGGRTWQRIMNIEVEQAGFHDVHCSPNGKGVYCVATASDYHYPLDRSPILGVSSDLLNWKILKPEDFTGPLSLPAKGDFYSAASL